MPSTTIDRSGSSLEDSLSLCSDQLKIDLRHSNVQSPAASFRSILAQFAYPHDSAKSTVALTAPRARKPAAPTGPNRLSLPITKTAAQIRRQDSDDGGSQETVDSSPYSTTTSGSSSKRKPHKNDVVGGRRKRPRALKESVLIPAGSVKNKLVDSLRPGLTLVMVGVNPSIKTGETGHAYCHWSNKFWPLMHSSGITPIQHKPAETHALMDLYGIGHTNIVAAASIAEKDIPKAVYQAGAKILDEKIRDLKPQAVALVGKNIWKNWFEYKVGRKFNDKKDPFDYGWQKEELWLGRTVNRDTRGVEWEGARTTVLPTTSAACAIWIKSGRDTRIEHWKPLGEWFTPKREEWIKAREGSGVKVEAAVIVKAEVVEC